MRIMNEIIEQITSANATVRKMLPQSGITLRSWLQNEQTKHLSNKNLSYAKSKKDLADICADYIAKRLNGDIAAMVRDAMMVGMMHTANHLGGLYSPQSFQGDLLFEQLLLQEAPKAPCVPIFSFGIVPLNSSTYGRGLMAFTAKEDIERLPIFPKKPTNAVAALMEGFDETMIRPIADRANGSVRSFLVRKQIKSLLEEVYLRKDVLSCDRYADQVLLLSEGLYNRLPALTGQKGFYHLEAETIFAKLFYKDVVEADGIISRLLFDPKCVRALNEVTDIEGRPLSSLLFRGGDAQKRCFTLNLCEDGFLRGMTQNGKSFEMKAKADVLIEALNSRIIFTDVLLSWVMSGFMRGFTWYGGIFQSQYLPTWHAGICKVFDTAGYSGVADPVRDYDASGYISGPVFLLFDNGETAANAGPLECMAKLPEREAFLQLIDTTDVGNAHKMGAFEIYNDLIEPTERTNKWYEKIGLYAKEHFSDNILQNL